jgi:valyl-tRNA synthetase
LISSPAGNDLLWDKSSNEQGRNFINKIWNALKLVELWKGREIAYIDMDQAAHAEMNWPNQWFRARLYQVRAEVNQMMNQFRLSEALKTIYSLIWDDFCSWYLEWIKPGFEEPMNSHHLSSAIDFFEELMELLHPFMPFVTEEIYQHLRERATGDNLCIAQLKSDETFTDLLSGKPAAEYLNEGNLLKDAISGIRDARNKAQLKPKETIKLFSQTTEKVTYTTIAGILSRQVNADTFEFTDSSVENSIPLVIGKDRFFLMAERPNDTGQQVAEMEKELEYLKGFLISVDKKLSNDRFIQNAKPEIIEMERKKKADAEIKISTLLESLTNLK